MKQIHEQTVIIDKHTRNEWVWKLIYWHRMVIEVQHLVYVEFVFSNLLRCPIFGSKGSKSKLAIIKIGNGENVSSSILLDFLHLVVAIWLSSVLLLEG